MLADKIICRQAIFTLKFEEARVLATQCFFEMEWRIAEAHDEYGF
jgi:hypothetical protein